eukprot:scaffold421256_cov54-Attheya_sp.AAC.1
MIRLISCSGKIATIFSFSSLFKVRSLSDVPVSFSVEAITLNTMAFDVIALYAIAVDAIRLSSRREYRSLQRSYELLLPNNG